MVVSLQTLFWVALATGSINAALAADGNSRVQLPGANDSFLQKVVNWMQSVLDFVGGAGALFFAFLSGFACIVLWGLAPKQSEAIGKLFRAAIAGIAAFNLAFFIAWLQK
ncbi:hypothetical protein KZ126_005026 [Salmonella enterica]|nr:hypothetical protein [Salmonella enterica]EIB9795936.1 hypothetical protein [Salmonella enterica subsp. enterica serovar Teshie]EHU5827536.1 hypothetical protein [Salmonella enterica]EHV2051945.1 hypothetical protein [Salmonella enterica]EHV2061183.1 hypothetical protein [Salmonella enterica]